MQYLKLPSLCAEIQTCHNVSFLIHEANQILQMYQNMFGTDPSKSQYFREDEMQKVTIPTCDLHHNICQSNRKMNPFSD